VANLRRSVLAERLYRHGIFAPLIEAALDGGHRTIAVIPGPFFVSPLIVVLCVLFPSG